MGNGRATHSDYECCPRSRESPLNRERPGRRGSGVAHPARVWAAARFEDSRLQAVAAPTAINSWCYQPICSRTRHGARRPRGECCCAEAETRTRNPLLPKQVGYPFALHPQRPCRQAEGPRAVEVTHPAKPVLETSSVLDHYPERACFCQAGTFWCFSPVKAGCFSSRRNRFLISARFFARAAWPSREVLIAW